MRYTLCCPRLAICLLFTSHLIWLLKSAPEYLKLSTIATDVSSIALEATAFLLFLIGTYRKRNTGIFKSVVKLHIGRSNRSVIDSISLFSNPNFTSTKRPSLWPRVQDSGGRTLGFENLGEGYESGTRDCRRLTGT